MLAFMLFAFVASITPGPTNFLVLSNSASHGLRAALPIILGAGAGAGAMPASPPSASTTNIASRCSGRSGRKRILKVKRRSAA